MHPGMPGKRRTKKAWDVRARELVFSWAQMATALVFVSWSSGEIMIFLPIKVIK